jgi:hypothetical protein
MGGAQDGNLDSAAVWPVGPAAFDCAGMGCSATRVKGSTKPETSRAVAFDAIP